MLNKASKKIKSNLIINVQGDEPLIKPTDIKKIIDKKKLFPNHVICGYDYISKSENPSNKNLPKVVINNKNELIYISRSKVPGSKKKISQNKFYKQVCIYAFSFYQLKKFAKTKKGPIETKEDIEILRFIENSISPVKMVDLGDIKLKAVDNPKDVFEVEKYLEN